MASLGKKRNRPTLEARMRGLAGQARKVELAEPAIRQHRTMRAQAQAQMYGLNAYGNDSYNTGNNFNQTLPDMKSEVKHGRRAKGQNNTPKAPATARSNASTVYSEDIPKRTTLVDQKKLDNDGEWDLIVQYNQREGRRIAAMAAQEIAKKKEENRKYLDVQVLEVVKRKKKEDRAKIEFVKEQKERLRRLEEEEVRKDAARLVRIEKVKVEQDIAAALVRERKKKEKERIRREDVAMLKRIEVENQKAREKEQIRLAKEKERAKELKEDLVKQLERKAQDKLFEAEEERQLQIVAKKKAEAEERKRKIALEELLEKMKSKQKIGESILLDVEAIARADEARALKHQAIYDEKKRKEAEDKVLAQQLSQKEVLESLEYQLQLKKERAAKLKAERKQDALLMAADAEKAHAEAMAVYDKEAAKKLEYYDVITEHINIKEQKRLAAVGMSKNERNLNARILNKMEAMGLQA